MIEYEQFSKTFDNTQQIDKAIIIWFNELGKDGWIIQQYHAQPVSTGVANKDGSPMYKQQINVLAYRNKPKTKKVLH